VRMPSTSRHGHSHFLQIVRKRADPLHDNCSRLLPIALLHAPLARFVSVSKLRQLAHVFADPTAPKTYYYWHSEIVLEISSKLKFRNHRGL